ncbi:hypothetical protein ACVW0P_000831 [Mucilaginibacter sp. UYNi724]
MIAIFTTSILWIRQASAMAISFYAANYKFISASIPIDSNAGVSYYPGLPNQYPVFHLGARATV